MGPLLFGGVLNSSSGGELNLHLKWKRNTKVGIVYFYFVKTNLTKQLDSLLQFDVNMKSIANLQMNSKK